MGRKLLPHTSVIFLLMESTHIIRHWPPWSIYSFIDPAGRKHNRRALRLSLFPAHLKVTAQWHLSLWDEQTHYLRSGPRALQGLSVLPLQVLRVISLLSSGVVTSGRQVWVQCPLTSFLNFSPSTREHAKGSPLKLLPPLNPSLEARRCPGRHVV